MKSSFLTAASSSVTGYTCAQSQPWRKKPARTMQHLLTAQVPRTLQYPAALHAFNVNSKQQLPSPLKTLL